MEGCEGWLGVWNVRFSQTIKWIFFSQNLGTSTAASALSIYIDTIFNKDISNGLRHTMPISVPGLSPYPDFLAFGFAVLITCKNLNI